MAPKEVTTWPPSKLTVLASSDTGKMLDFIVFAHNLWAGPFLLLACTLLLLHLLGWPPAIAGKPSNPNTLTPANHQTVNP